MRFGKGRKAQPSTVETIALLIEGRIAETEVERARLCDALASLRTTAAVTATPSPEIQAVPGQRQRQLLDSIKANPGLTTADHARAIGITPGHAYSVAAQLKKQGMVWKNDQSALEAVPQT